MRPPAERLEAPGLPNPARAQPQWPQAVIAGGYRTGVLAMRGLSRRGVRVHCVETAANRDYPAFLSRYGRARECPDPDAAPGAWVDFMLRLARELGGRPVLIPSADQFVSAIGEHTEALAEQYTLCPGALIQAALTSKASQYALVKEHEFPVPRTSLVASEHDVSDFASGAEFPCLLKPLSAREWHAFPREHPLYGQKVAVAATRAALVDAWRAASAANPRLIAQEVIQGPDTDKRVYVTCRDRSGRRVAHATFRELRCDPLRFGPATMSEPIDDAETVAVCDAFLDRVGYVGVCEFEMKRDGRDGRVKLIEINPRLTGGGDAAPYAGVDTCWLHYLDLIGEPVSPVVPVGNNFRHVVLRSDATAMVAYWRTGLVTIGEILRSYRSPLAFYDFDWHDWRYSAETIVRMGRAALAEVVAPIRRRFWRRRAAANTKDLRVGGRMRKVRPVWPLGPRGRQPAR